MSDNMKSSVLLRFEAISRLRLNGVDSSAAVLQDPAVAHVGKHVRLMWCRLHAWHCRHSSMRVCVAMHHAACPACCSSFQEHIEMENRRLEEEGQFWAKEIVVRIEYKFCPNLTIIDTPGG